MNRFSSTLLILALLLIGLCFYQGWFTLTASREVETKKLDVKFSVDEEKMKRDGEAVKKSAHDLTSPQSK